MDSVLLLKLFGFLKLAYCGKFTSVYELLYTLHCTTVKHNVTNSSLLLYKMITELAENRHCVGIKLAPNRKKVCLVKRVWLWQKA
jgi:hypothetical protein